MTFEQTLRILDTIGVWFAGMGTFAAAGLALWLARRSEKVKLKVSVGFRLLISHGNSDDCLVFDVTNIGERPVTISNVGWSVGRLWNRKFAIQLIPPSSNDRCPKKIEYGESAFFVINYADSPDWAAEFVEKIIVSESAETLRARIHTSVGYTKVVKPERNLLVKLQDAQANLRKSGENRK